MNNWGLFGGGVLVVAMLGVTVYVVGPAALVGAAIGLFVLIATTVTLIIAGPGGWSAPPEAPPTGELY